MIVVVLFVRLQYPLVAHLAIQTALSITFLVMLSLRSVLSFARPFGS